VAKIDSKIVLIDGEHLSQLMIDHNVGVASVASYETKRIDSDYFIEGYGVLFRSPVVTPTDWCDSPPSMAANTKASPGARSARGLTSPFGSP